MVEQTDRIIWVYGSHKAVASILDRFEVPGSYISSHTNNGEIYWHYNLLYKSVNN
jgi:hypothetical protein